MDRLRETAIKSEKEKGDLEKKIRDTEYCVAILTDEKDKRTAEADKLKKELIFARAAERDATQKLLNFLSRTVSQSQSGESTITSQSIAESPISDIELNSYDLAMDGDIEQISREIEKERWVHSIVNVQGSVPVTDLRLNDDR